MQDLVGTGGLELLAGELLATRWNYWPDIGKIGQTLELLASHWNYWPDFQGSFLANSSNPPVQVLSLIK